MMDIYQLAVLFRIRSLEHVCLQYLEFRISKHNVLDALYNADKLQLRMIKEFCLAYIVRDEHMQEIVMSDEFAALERALMVEVIRRRFQPGKAEMRPTDGGEGTTLEMDMAAFLKHGAPFCDIDLQLEDEQIIPAHRSILAARCTYFQAMFRSFAPPDGGTVNIQIGDIQPPLKAFQSLLCYIYYGEKKMPAEDSLYLFDAPAFYGM